MSQAAISARVARGAWRSLYPAVYLAADHELTDEARLRAAVLWAGPDGTAHGVAAAWWLGLWPALPEEFGVTVPRRRYLPSRAGLRVRRRDLDPSDRTVHRGVPITAAGLTMLEAAVALGERGSELLDRALQRHVPFQAVYQAHCRSLGRRGSAAAATLLSTAADRADSQAEHLMIKILREAGVDGWRRGYLVVGYELDFAFPAERLAIEIDGWAWHSDAARSRYDRRRQNALVLAGWVVLRFTWHDLAYRPASVITQIRSVLSGAA